MILLTVSKNCTLAHLNNIYCRPIQKNPVNMENSHSKGRGCVEFYEWHAFEFFGNVLSFCGIVWQQVPHSYSWLRERDAVRQTLHRRPCLMHLNSKRPSIPQIPLNTLSTPTFSLFMPTFSDSSEAIEMEGWWRERDGEPWKPMMAVTNAAEGRPGSDNEQTRWATDGPSGTIPFGLIEEIWKSGMNK